MQTPIQEWLRAVQELIPLRQIDPAIVEKVKEAKEMMSLGSSQSIMCWTRFKGWRHSDEESRFYQTVGEIAAMRLGEANLQEWRAKDRARQ